MTRRLNIYLQILALIGHAMNQFSGMVPASWVQPIMFFLFIGQGAVAIIASAYNPDGTKAVFPYQPPPSLKDLGLKPSPAPKPKGRAQTMVLLFLAAALLLAMFLVAGCATLLTGTSDPKEAAALIEGTKMRGCLFTRIHGRMAAGETTTIVVGTVGDPGPGYEACWKSLPIGLP